MAVLSPKNLFGTLIVTKCLQLCLAIQCERECCYWYRRIPATTNCNRNSTKTDLFLNCDIQYQLSINSTNVEVKWYRSTSEQSAGIEGENIDHLSVISQTPINISATIGVKMNRLSITNFSVSDIGFYWCQMEVNNGPLPPSPFGYINISRCTTTEVTCDLKSQPICALNSSSRLMAHTEENGLNCSINSITESRITTISVTESVTLPSQYTESMNDSSLTIGLSVGVFVLVTVSLMVTIVLLILFYKKRKTECKLPDSECVSEKEEVEETDKEKASCSASMRKTDLEHEPIILNYSQCGIPNSEEQCTQTTSLSIYDTVAEKHTQVAQEMPEKDLSTNDAQKEKKNYDQFPVYAVVNKTKKTSIRQCCEKSTAVTKVDLTMISLLEEKEENDLSKPIVLMPKYAIHCEEQKESHLAMPVYAEVMTKTGKKDKSKITSEEVENNSTEEKSSCNYDKLSFVGIQRPRDQQKEENEQSYYHRLDSLTKSGGAGTEENKPTAESSSTSGVYYSMPHTHHLVVDDTPKEKENIEFATVRKVSIPL